MKVSKAFIEDFDYLTRLYHWDQTDVAEMKEWVRSDQVNTMPYITGLAAQWKRAEGIRA